MTEQASIFGGMVHGERIDTLRAMTIVAEFLRLFFLHGHKPFMVIIMRQFGCRFRWSIPEKEKETDAESNKEQIIDKDFLFTVHPGDSSMDRKFNVIDMIKVNSITAQSLLNFIPVNLPFSDH